MMLYRPARTHHTQCVYIHGPPGVGKTTTVNAVLDAFAEREYDYYAKSGGFDKYWDCYDNEPFVLIDDPAPIDPKTQPDAISMIKQLISHGKCGLQVKYGWVQFDSHLVFVVSNYSPFELSRHCNEATEAIVDRFQGTRAYCKPIYVPSQQFAEKQLKPMLVDMICEYIEKEFEEEIDYGEILSSVKLNFAIKF